MTPISQTRRDLLKGAAALAAAQPSARGRHDVPPAHAQGSAGPARARIDGVLRQAVDAKEVPGVVAMAADRRGRVLRGRLRHARARAGRGRMTLDTVFRIASMTKADHLGRGDAARRARQARARRAGAEHRPRARRAPGARRLRRRGRADPAPGEAADHAAPPADPHRRLRLRHLEREHRRATSRATGMPSTGDRPRSRPCACRWSSIPATAGSTASASTGSAGSSRRSAACRSTTTSASTSSRRSAWPTPASCPARPARAPGARSTSARPTASRRSRSRRSAPGVLRAAAGCYSTGRDYLTFLQMLLHGGTFNGARILRPETVALMNQNHIGELPAGS